VLLRRYDVEMSTANSSHAWHNTASIMKGVVCGIRHLLTVRCANKTLQKSNSLATR